MKKPKTHQEYVWVVAYINTKFVSKVDRELSKFTGIEVRIPTVTVLEKNFKKKAHYKEVPILFNYGFFRVPKIMALNPDFMEKLKAQITCITGWVKDPVRGKNQLATCSYDELLVLYQEAEEESIYSDKEVENLKEGQQVILRGYPFEGIHAKILNINKSKREVEVEIKTFGNMKSVKVCYENLIYNIYRDGHDDSLMNHVSLDELAERKTINRVFRNQSHDE